MVIHDPLSRDTPLHLSYRREVVQEIMNCILAGDSCALVGVASIGKSNLFRFLLRSDVQQEYLGDHADRFILLYIDGNSMVEMSEYGVYELLLHRMLQQIEALAGHDELLTRVDDLYQRAVTSQSRIMAQRYVERSVRSLCQHLDLRLVILFDEFDELLEQLDRRFFLNLRALRDDFKYKVCYVVATRRAPVMIREDVAERCEAFYELLTLNVYGLKPYSQDDALEMIDRLARRHDVRVPEEHAKRLVMLTGGHPGLLAAAFEVARRARWPSLAVYGSDRYLEDDYVWGECNKVWESIDEDERHMLLRIPHKQAWPHSDDYLTDHLEVKGLISRDRSTARFSIFSPIFASYVLRQGPIGEGISREGPNQ